MHNIIEDGLHIIKEVNDNINLEGDDFDNRLIDFWTKEFYKEKFN